MSGTRRSAIGVVRYEWERYWCEHTGMVELSDAGFLRDPTGPFAGELGLKTLEALAEIPALALLGEPGIGKSTGLKAEHERLLALADQNKLSHYVDLKISADENRLHRLIFEAPIITQWQGGESHLTVHLDSLDEALLQLDTISHLIAEVLRTLPSARLSIRIACRTAAWPTNTLGSVYVETWGKTGVAILEMAPLRRRDVLAAISAHGINPDEFMAALFGAHAVPFAIKPLTLKMLINLYQRDGNLPNSVAALYRQGCIALCDEQNESRRDARRLGRLNAPQRLRLAGRIAAATILGRQFAVWTGPEVETPRNDVPISALAGIVEQGEFAAFTATDNDVREVLDTGLFSARGDHRMGWAHDIYGEFLAALYLFEKGVPAATLRKALTHSTGGLFPPLAGIGAWAASLNSEFRVSLIATDPWPLLLGDLSNWAPGDLAALVSSLLAYVEAGGSFDRFFGIAESYGRLKHPGISTQLRATITNPSLRSITRRMAFSIAERCELKDLRPELLLAALNQSEEPWLRAAAIAALRTCGDASVPPQILSILIAGIGSDPHTEILGYALDLLWPNHINATQLFSFLTGSDEHYVGSFASFVFDLADKLQTSDLVPALNWATAYINRSNLMGEFRDKTLADAIMFKAWEVFEEPSLTSPFLAHIMARLHQHGELIRGTNTQANDAFKERLRSDFARRRRFILVLCQYRLDAMAAFTYIRKGVVRNEDFEWLLEISPGGGSTVPGLNEECLCSFITNLNSFDDNAKFEQVYRASLRWPRLETAIAPWVDGILIDSQDATQAREILRLTKQLDVPPHPAIVPDLPAEIENLVASAEFGDWASWWKLSVILTLTPTSWAFTNELELFITAMPGWTTANLELRRRILITAEIYLSDADCTVDAWLGTNPTRFNHNDIAAKRAFILFHQAAPEIYTRIALPVWEKWAPVIVGLRAHLIGDSSDEVRHIFQDALANAPAVFLSTVRKLLHLEKVRHRAEQASGGKPAFAPFTVLRTLNGCWSNSNLKEMLFEELQDADLQPVEYAEILNALTSAGFLPAIEHAVARLGLLSEDTVEIAKVLLNQAPGTVWPVLWPKLLSNDAFARSVFLNSVRLSYAADPFYADFPAEAIADLYLLLERLFPSVPNHPPASGWMSDHDMIPHLRDGAPRRLAAIGTEEAVQALMRLAATRPDLELLPFELSRGQAAMRHKTWLPLTIQEIFAVTDRPSSKLVTSPADLLELLAAALAKYNEDLSGAHTPVRNLWDKVSGKTVSYRPIEEDGLSNDVVRFLQQELIRSGIVANREVEVSRRPGAPIGKRTDILVNAIRRGLDEQLNDVLTAVIEVKGCWNDELFDAITSQLVQDYMVKLRAPIGIYLVGWFDKAQWDKSDYRRRKVPRLTLSEVSAQLGQQARTVPAGFSVRPIILDIKAPGA